MADALDIRRAGLLLLDLQRDTLHPAGAAARQGLGGLEPGQAPALVAAWQQLADEMRAAGRPVVWVTTAFRPDYMDAGVATAWLERRRGTADGLPGDFLIEGSWGAELLDGLEPDPQDFGVVKKAHGAFAGTSLDRLLTNLGVEQCIVAGGGVADSVTETVRTGGMLGYRMFVVTDATYPPDAPELRDRGLRIFPGGQVTSTAEVLAGAAAAGRPTPDAEQVPQQSALLIVDMQNDFVSPQRPAVVYGGSSPIPTDKRARMLGNASAAASAVRARGWPVVHIRTARRVDNLDEVHGWSPWREDTLPPGVTHVAEGTWGAQIVDELQPEPDDFVVEKKGASGFGLTHLHRLLRNLGIHRCLVAGGSTTGCVRATMFDGLALGYDITILRDATYPPDSPTVEFLARWCAVRPTDDVLTELKLAEAKASAG